MMNATPAADLAAADLAAADLAPYELDAVRLPSLNCAIRYEIVRQVRALVDLGSRAVVALDGPAVRFVVGRGRNVTFRYESGTDTYTATECDFRDMTREPIIREVSDVYAENLADFFPERLRR